MAENLRRTYEIKSITVNGKLISQVIIDPHYEVKHGGSINDPLILRMVFELNDRFETPEVINGKYSFYATLVELDRRRYRLIWLLEEGSLYVGIVNAYRDNRSKKNGISK